MSLLVAAGAFLAMVLLARLVPDAPPQILLATPDGPAGSVLLDRVLLGVVCVGVVAAAVLAGRSAERHRASATVALVSLAIVVVGVLGSAVLWGTDETADEQGVQLVWMEPTALGLFAATTAAAVMAVAAGACTLRRGVDRD